MHRREAVGLSGATDTAAAIAPTESVRCFGASPYRAQAHIVAFWAALFGRIHCLRLGVNLERHTLTLSNLLPRLSAKLCAGLSGDAV